MFYFCINRVTETDWSLLQIYLLQIWPRATGRTRSTKTTWLMYQKCLDAMLKLSKLQFNAFKLKNKPCPFFRFRICENPSYLSGLPAAAAELWSEIRRCHWESAVWAEATAGLSASTPSKCPTLLPWSLVTLLDQCEKNFTGTSLHLEPWSVTAVTADCTAACTPQWECYFLSLSTPISSDRRTGYLSDSSFILSFFSFLQIMAWRLRAGLWTCQMPE